MSWLHDMKLGKRLGLGYGGLAAALIAVGTIGLVAILQINGRIDRWQKEAHQFRQVSSMKAEVDNVYLHLAEMVMVTDLAERNGLGRKIEQRWDSYKSTMNELQSQAETEEGKRQLVNVDEAVGAAREANTRVSALALQGRTAEATATFAGQSLQQYERTAAAFDNSIRP
jgi:methyl-accepting chemotaxis protein